MSAKEGDNLLKVRQSDRQDGQTDRQTAKEAAEESEEGIAIK